MRNKLGKFFLFGKQNKIILITGLAIGMVVSIFVGRFAYVEYSYDRYNKDYKRIYRSNGTEGMLLSDLATKNLSYVENAARVHPCYRGVTILAGETGFYEDRAYYADGSLFDILSIEVKEGNAKESLKEKGNVVISERYAKKYFGTVNAVGKTLIVNGSYENNALYTVSAVMRDMPTNSHCQFDVLFSARNILVNNMYATDDPWRWRNFFTYFKTTVPIDETQFNEELTRLELINGMPQITDSRASCPVSRLTDLHLNDQVNFMDNNRNKSDINVRVYITLIIVIIGWFNVISLGTGNALKNRLSLSVKEALGASKSNIWSEFFKQYLILGSIAFILSVIVYMIINQLLILTGVIEPLYISFNAQLILWAVLVTAQIAGTIIISYSVYYLGSRNRFAAISGVYGALPKQRNSVPFTIMFVFQFFASIVLICFALFSSRQVDYLLNMDKGIQTNHILAIHNANFDNNNDITGARGIFGQEVVRIPGVTTATSASYIPGSTISSYMPTRLSGHTADDNIDCRMNFVGYDFLDIFEHKLIAGRDFSKDILSDREAIIINQTLAKAYGFDDVNDAVGKDILWESRNENRHIIGVMEDFHHQSAEMPIEPVLFQLREQADGYCLLKINSSNPKETIDAVKNLWIRVHQGNAFDYFWIDALYQQQFTMWLQYVRLVKVLALIAILVACIGLYGVCKLIMDKRTKEIGIRKVSGANVPEILLMTTRYFVQWILVAFILAIPVASVTTHKWLEKFVFQTNLNWWVFAVSGIMVLTVAILSISRQSWKAATRNPVEALRYE